MLQRFKHIKVVKKRLADGTINFHRYHRKTGKKIEGEPGTPTFAASYAAASEFDVNRVPTGTIHALVEQYFQSSVFSELSPRTQIDHRRNADKVLDKFGNAPIEVFEDKRIRKDLRQWRDKIAKEIGPRQADYRVAFLRRVLSVAYDNGEIGINHARNLGQLYTGDRADKIWEDEHIEAFLAHATPEMALALRLALDTVQRQGDLIRLSWTQFDGSCITLRQNKTAKPIMVPCTALLCAALHETPKRATTILTGKRGKPWKYPGDGFRTEWNKISVAAGITDLTFNDLRGTGITRMAEAGCEIPEIATISGHSVDRVARIIDTYLARTNRMASSAIAKLEDYRRRAKT